MGHCSMPTDSLFYLLFVNFPHLFFQLVQRPVSDPTADQFKSVTVKQTSLTMDGVLLPSPDQPEDPLFFTEVQFQPDPDLYYRLFAEIGLYLRQYQPKRPWMAVVLFPTEGWIPACLRSTKSWMISSSNGSIWRHCEDRMICPWRWGWCAWWWRLPLAQKPGHGG